MKKLLIVLLLIVSSHMMVWAQQDAQLSQYMFNGIYINPAYAGYQETLNISSSYRTQWPGLVGGPRTMSLAVDAALNENKVGLALQIAKDQLGAQTNISVYGNYAYRLTVDNDDDKHLAFGIGFGFRQLGLDGSKLNPINVEPDQPAGTINTIIPDARAGVYYSGRRFYAGFSADNLIAQYIKMDKYAYIPQPKPHIYLTAGLLLPLSKDIQIKPSFLLKDDLAGPTSLDLNAFLMFADQLWIGGGYRSRINLYKKGNLQNNLSFQNSAIAALQIFSIKNIRIGYSYDFAVSALKGSVGGTHELSIGYSLNVRKMRMRSPRYF